MYKFLHVSKLFRTIYKSLSDFCNSCHSHCLKSHCRTFKLRSQWTNLAKWKLEELEKNANLERVKREQTVKMQEPVKTEPKEEEKTFDLIFKVTGTANQMLALREFLISNNIKFSKVEGE